MENRIDIKNSDLNAIALNILKEYSIEPDNLSVVQGGGVKTVWKLKAQDSQFCLKRLKQTIDKVLFSVNAQIYIKNSGGKVPEIILNRNGEPITQYNGQLFVLYEWIDGRDLDLSVPTDFRRAVCGLAGFHVASRGYLPSPQSRISTKVGKWPDQYTSMKKKMVEWKKIALKEIESGSKTSAQYSEYAANVDSIIDIADTALEKLNESAYRQLTEAGSSSIVLCHQDFGKGNVLEAPDGIYVLDLDGVTFDLPARDLRKIIGKTAENAGRWSYETISGILDWYVEINPLDSEEIAILYIDLLFPHWFYGLVKNIFQNGKSLKPSEIERIAKLEVSKESILLSLLQRSD